MTKYVVGRLVSGLVTLLLYVTVLFFLVNIVIPGDFTTQFIQSAEARESMMEALGIDRPLWQQYLTWMGGVMTLNLGQSFRGEFVWDVIVEVLPVTLLALGVGLGLAFILGGWLGRVSGYGNASYFSGVITVVAVLFMTAFPPALAIAMEQSIVSAFGHGFLVRLADVEGMGPQVGVPLDNLPILSPTQVMYRMAAVLAATFVFLWLLDWGFHRVTRRRVPRLLFLLAMVGIPIGVWSLMGIHRPAVDVSAALSLLVVGVVILTFGDVLLVTRAAMEDVMLEDYVMVARAKGLPERRVRDHHAARTALLPMLSRFTVSIPYFLSGLVILEAVFIGSGATGVVDLRQEATGLPGLGTVIFDAVRQQDTPLIAGSLLVVGVITVLLRTALEVAHFALDPRIRVDGGADEA